MSSLKENRKVDGMPADEARRHIDRSIPSGLRKSTPGSELAMTLGGTLCEFNPKSPTRVVLVRRKKGNTSGLSKERLLFKKGSWKEGKRLWH